MDDKLPNLKLRRTALTIVAGAFFVVLCALVMVPFVGVILASFRPGQELIRYGLNLKIDPAKMTLSNYKFLFTGDHSYFMWFKNSVVLTFLSVITTLLVCYFVAYGLTMYNFKLKNFLFFLVIATMMVPFEILLLPLYREIISMHLINTTWGVILPRICGASTIFFFRQYLLSVPRALLDSGRIDGANEYRICFEIVMPIAKPSFAAMAILSAMSAWNDMLWPLLVYRDSSKFTLVIGMNTLLTPYGNNYDLLIAGSCFSLLPVFIVFLCFQRYFIDGMTAGAVKG